MYYRCNIASMYDIICLGTVFGLKIGLFAWISLTALSQIYYIPEKRKFSGILCFRQRRRRRVIISLSAR